MPLWAEHDLTTGNIVAFKNDDGPGEPAVNASGMPRTPGAKTEWLPMEVEYPEEYVPRFPHLLGPSTFSLENGVVKQRFPESNFTPDHVREALKGTINRTLRAVLAETDWYFVRRLEHNIPVPADVSAFRTRVRAKADQMKQELSEAPNIDLLDFDTDIPFQELFPPQSVFPISVGRNVAVITPPSDEWKKNGELNATDAVENPHGTN